MTEGSNHSVCTEGRKPARRLAAPAIFVLVLTMLGAALAQVETATAGLDAQAVSTADDDHRPVRACETLTLLNFSDGTQVTSAVTLQEAPPVCSVTLLVPERINVSVLLPVETWNGRFQGVGGGGYDGVPVWALLSDATEAGYAAASTDTGHSGAILNGEWAWSPTGQNWSQIQDFGFRSLDEMTVKAKAVIEAYYGQPSEYSYWNGCSTGGRQGLMLAQRYPDHYDGILAGAPAINWPRFHPAQLWPQVLMRAGDNIVPQCKFEAVNAAAIEACDGLTGVEDGVIDPSVCDFDPATLVGTETDCGTITEEDAALVEAIWEGAKRTDGSFMWYGLEPGASFSGLANTVSSGDQGIEGVPFPIAADWVKWWLEKDPTWTWQTAGATVEQLEAWYDQSTEEYDWVLATDDPDLRPFRDRGGKVILWHGWADDLIFPRGTIDYYERAVDTLGDRHELQDFARLFMAPGVAHCGGGAGPAPADPFGAVVDWVERGQAPDKLLASRDTVTRPLCPWPQVARYDGQGSTEDAASFTCADSYSLPGSDGRGRDRPDHPGRGTDPGERPGNGSQG